MPLLDFTALAAQLPDTWKSTRVGQVGPARIKVLRMDAQAYEEETHDYNEGLLVIDGLCACLLARRPSTSAPVRCTWLKPASPTRYSPAAKARW